jgi:hypothetical protein
MLIYSIQIAINIHIFRPYICTELRCLIQVFHDSKHRPIITDGFSSFTASPNVSTGLWSLQNISLWPVIPPAGRFLKQSRVELLLGRHDVLLENIILIQRQPVFGLNS